MHDMKKELKHTHNANISLKWLLKINNNKHKKTVVCTIWELGVQENSSFDSPAASNVLFSISSTTSDLYARNIIPTL